MTPDEDNIEDILNRHLPSALQEEVESDCSRILQRLRSRADQKAGHRSFSASRWPRFALLTTLAIAVVAVVVGFDIVLWQPAFATVESVDGFLFEIVNGRLLPMVPGQAIDAGATIRATGGAGGTIVLADGTRVEARAGSKLTLERANDGVRIRLDTGGVIVNAAKQENRHLYVQTRDVVVEVVGTIFLVEADEEGSRVAVIVGEVRVTEGSLQRHLKSGDQFTTNRRTQMIPVREEVSWSRNAKEHVALLEQTQNARRSQAAQPFQEALITPMKPGPQSFRPRPGRDGRCEGSVEIEPARLVATNISVYYLITLAYSDWTARWWGDCTTVTMLNVLSGEPSWARTELFDIQAIIPPGSPNYRLSQLRNGQAPALQEMLQKLLQERFNLVVRHENKEMPIHVLTVEEGGPKFKTFIDISRMTPVPSPKGIFRDWTQDAAGDLLTTISFRKQTMSEVANLLAWETRRPFIDRTGIRTPVDFDVSFATENDPFLGERPMNTKTGQPPRYASGPGLAAAFKDHGLRLESGNGPVDVLVIERMDKPSEN